MFVGLYVDCGLWAMLALILHFCWCSLQIDGLMEKYYYGTKKKKSLKKEEKVKKEETAEKDKDGDEVMVDVDADKPKEEGEDGGDDKNAVKKEDQGDGDDKMVDDEGGDGDKKAKTDGEEKKPKKEGDDDDEEEEGATTVVPNDRFDEVCVSYILLTCGCSNRLLRMFSLGFLIQGTISYPG